MGSRMPRAHEGLCEPLLAELEPRRLLAGFTLIAHGYPFAPSSPPQWMTSMAAAIAGRAGLAGVARIPLVIDRHGVVTGTPDHAANEGSLQSGEFIGTLDWT